MIDWFFKKTVGDNKVANAALILSAIGLCVFGVGYMLNGAARLVDEIDDINEESDKKNNSLL